MAKARKYVLRSYFSGLPKRDDVEIVEEELPALQDGGQGTKPCFAAVDLLIILINKDRLSPRYAIYSKAKAEHINIES